MSISPRVNKRIQRLIDKYRQDSAIHRQEAPYQHDIALKYEALGKAEVYRQVANELEALLTICCAEEGI